MLVVLSVGCASTAFQQDAMQVAEFGADEAIEHKILRGRALTVDEIVALQEKNVPEEVIVRNLNASWAVYELRSADVERLKAAGTSESVIDAMLASGTKYRRARVHRHPYFFHGHHSHRHGFHRRHHRRHHRHAHHAQHYHDHHRKR